MTFLLLEDETGLTNIVVHQSLYERERLTLRTSPVLLIEGRLERQGDAVNIVAQKMTPIPIEPPAAEQHEPAAAKQPKLLVTSHDYR